MELVSPVDGRAGIDVPALGATGGGTAVAVVLVLPSDLGLAPKSALDCAEPSVAPAAEAAVGATVAADEAEGAELGDFGCAKTGPSKSNHRDNPKNKTFQNLIFDPLELAGRTELKTRNHGAAQFAPSKLQSSGNRKDF